MIASTARYSTAHAAKYMEQLCKHFGHKVAAEYDATTASVAMPLGPVTMTADAEGLTVRVTAEDLKNLIHARFVIDSHLVTFAHREEFSGLSWVLE